MFSKNSILVFLLTYILFGLTIIGCNSNPIKLSDKLNSSIEDQVPTNFPFTITDSSNTSITFKQPPDRIIVLDSASIEILFAINQGHRIVGTHSFVTYPDEAKAIPDVGNSFEINFEKIAQLNPDLIFIFYDRFLSDLKRLGFNVLFLKSANLTTTINNTKAKDNTNIPTWNQE